jgi:hypothetical protein
MDGNYLALSQTVTAFMHEYLVGFESVVESVWPGVAQRAQGVVQLSALEFDALGYAPLLVLFIMGSAIWVLTTYHSSTEYRAQEPASRRPAMGLRGLLFRISGSNLLGLCQRLAPAICSS